MSQRSHDHRAIPLCMQCHRDRHNHSGSFKHVSRDYVRQWEQDLAMQMRALWGALARPAKPPVSPDDVF